MAVTYSIQFADLQPQDVAVVHGRVRSGALPEFLGGAFGEVARVMAEQGLLPIGPPFGRYRFDDDGSCQVEAGFPCAGIVTDAGRVRHGRLPGGRVAHTLHVGDYAAVGAAYQAAVDFIVANGHEPAGVAWERYLDGPDVASPRTEVFVPCRPVRPRGEPQA
ncbi:GyrI-like domain-containing protein [Nocardioides mesophilus]|uniref:GyrI-like domain-containing protein n=1 Tax=Nocardioides mesophilus TaxID=433659 RepID=A0A7G9RD24_9ACTN|nr:GyrI-like domain-containing protein [Nocardioides mesophilus]QNN53499.1 GyrI-like domain-containing protein [Nocardioides mesophilus]